MATIRNYNDSTDQAGVLALWRTVFEYDAAHNEPTLAIARKVAVNDGLFFIATLDARTVGTVMAGYDGHRGWLYSVAVHPDQQRTGSMGKVLQVNIPGHG